MKKMTLISAAAAAAMTVGCANQTAEQSGCAEKNCAKTENCEGTKAHECDGTKKCKGKFVKKYTNADYYTDGKFNEDVAIKAMKEMLEFYDIPFTPFMEENFWVAEFGLGDFENTGMGGIFWINNAETKYFAHTIYLLPGQMIPEHKHMPTADFAAKDESWLVQCGWCYNFSEVGEATPGAPALPATQQASALSKNFVRQNKNEFVSLKKVETYHFLYAGDEGAIVIESANYHDGNGLRFSNPAAKM